MIRFPDGNHHDLILRTDNGRQYVSEIFKNTLKILGIRSEYIQKLTPEDKMKFKECALGDYIIVRPNHPYLQLKRMNL